MSSTNGRTNRNERGSSYDRRARRAWLVTPKAGFGGDNVKVPCWECGVMLTKDELIVDRIISGEDGGRYIRTNIRPQCPGCSGRSGQRRTVVILAAKRAANTTDHWHDDDGRYTGPLRTNTAWPPLQECEDVPVWALTG